MAPQSVRPPTDLFVSPHLDDAVLSAGGVIAARVREGVRVVVASLCTADPPAGRELGALARRFHSAWGSDAPSRERREEDARACARLGAEPRHLGLLDAIYRGEPDGPDGYRSVEALFAEPAGWDGEFTERATAELRGLAAELRPARIYGPLAAGSNVDHRHALRALERLHRGLGAPLWLYEDQPYTAGSPSLPGGAQGLRDALERCALRLEPELHAIDLAAKSAAIRCYGSQLAEIFGPDLAGLAALEAYHRALRPGGAPAERLWHAIAD